MRSKFSNQFTLAIYFLLSFKFFSDKAFNPDRKLPVLILIVLAKNFIINLSSRVQKNAYLCFFRRKREAKIIVNKTKTRLAPAPSCIIFLTRAVYLPLTGS